MRQWQQVLLFRILKEHWLKHCSKSLGAIKKKESIWLTLFLFIINANPYEATRPNSTFSS